MLEVMIHGMLLAFGLILPLGAQNIFLFNQGAMQPKFIYAFPAWITAALCDTLLILLAVFGVSAIVLQFEWLRITMMSVGVLFLSYMAWSIWHSEPPQDVQGYSMPMKKQMLFAASVSLLNPHAILDTIGVIGSSALAYTGAAQWYFAISCIVVSWCFFLALVILGAIFKKLQLPRYAFVIMNKLSAIFIVFTAIYLVTTLFA